MIRVTLPSGATADLRPVEDITERQRRPIKRVQTQLAKLSDFGAAIEKAQAIETSGKGKLSKADQDTIAEGLGEAFDPLEELNDRLIVAAVMGWSYPFPVEYDAVLDLPARDLDRLRELVSPYLPQLMPDFSVNKDRETPTGV
jgi:hypothetical protein